MIAEEDRVEELKAVFDIVKSATIRLLGLNINPVDDENGKLRPPKDTEIIPLSIFCGTETILHEVLERNKQLVEQEKIEVDIESGAGGPMGEMSADELDALMNDMGDTGDIEFDDADDLFSNPDWNSEEARAVRKQLIQTLDDVPGINRKSKVTIQEIDDGDMPDLTNPTKSVIDLVEED